MLIKLRIGTDAGTIQNVRNDIALQMIADGRAEDPYANVREEPIVETEVRKPAAERAVHPGSKRFRR